MIYLFIVLVPVVFMTVGLFVFSINPKKRSNSDPKITDLFYAETEDKCRTVTELYDTIRDIKENGGEYLKNKKFDK